MWYRVEVWCSSIAIFASLLGLPALAGYVAAGWPLAAVLTVIVIVAGWSATRYADRYLLRAQGAEPLDPRRAPEVYELLFAIADRAAMPAPRLYLVPSAEANAITVGRGPGSASIALTVGLLRRLDLRELAGVLAHELAHVKHRDIVLGSIAASVTGMLASLWRMLALPTLLALPLLVAFAPKLLAAFALLLLAPAVAVFLQAALSRQRELAADAEAARLTGDPEGLAAALARLEPKPHPLLVLLFGRRAFERPDEPFDSHPSTRERIERLLRLSRGT